VKTLQAHKVINQALSNSPVKWQNPLHGLNLTNNNNIWINDKTVNVT